ncbi:hypothetical protein N7520_003410 [Penicillium odoratum]|uniref:uncharacterized protein n=1 Tax=Penicillium odoratum TaxID=1167516 RepID=UPI002548639D|nr:uncharacterized protein N7520_003410 [Penicillium odoratum]KAJ5768851.1 hypothetical protein N7520_003410 [Penicillium odoratum]
MSEATPGGLDASVSDASQPIASRDAPETSHSKTSQASGRLGQTWPHTPSDGSSENTKRSEAEETKPLNRQKLVTYPLSKSKVSSVLEAHNLSTSLTDRVSGWLNAKLAHTGQDRYIDQKTLHLAVVLRASSLYSQGLGPQQWKDGYTEIYKAKHYKRVVRKKGVIPALKEEGLVLLAKIQTDCLGSFRREWQAMDQNAKADAWQPLAFWLLQNEPKLLLNFLIVTTEGQVKPDFSMVADCLLYLDAFYYQDWLKDWRSGTCTYRSVIESCLNPNQWPVLSLPQKGVRLYIRRAGHEAVSLALNIAKERSLYIGPETALCFMWRFTEFEDADRALEALAILPSLKKDNFSMNSQSVHRHCCKLLTLDTVEEETGERNFKILPRLLEMGITPDRDMLNVVLANAFKTNGELGSDILQFMQSHGYELDSYSYLTLLKDAVARGDRGHVDSLIREVETQEELRKNPWIASKIFHSYYIFTVKHIDADADPSDIFYSMLDMYNNIYDITPLKELSVIPPRYIPRSDGANAPPSPIPLYIMLATYFRCQNRLANVQRIYGRFRELVAQGHPSIAPMVETDHTYNEFLIAFRNSPRGLRSCVQLVEDMLHPASPQLDQTDKAIVPTKPTVRTWTLLLGSFIFHRQIKASERIREMMDNHNVQYSDVTWNIIVNGYANAQNIPETAAAIKAMEQEGFSIDSYTMKSLRYLRDPERLWIAIDELDRKATETSLALGTETESTGNKQQDHDQLVDSGLEKLGSKMKPQPQE